MAPRRPDELLAGRATRTSSKTTAERVTRSEPGYRASSSACRRGGDTHRGMCGAYGACAPAGRRPARACEAELGAVLLQGPCPVAGLRMLCLGAAGEPLERSAGLLYAFMINFVRITHGTSLVRRSHTQRQDCARPADPALRAPKPSWTVSVGVGRSGAIMKNGACTLYVLGQSGHHKMHAAQACSANTDHRRPCNGAGTASHVTLQARGGCGVRRLGAVCAATFNRKSLIGRR